MVPALGDWVLLISSVLQIKPSHTRKKIYGGLSNRFLFYFLQAKKEEIVGLGVAQPNISQTILKEITIPLPPLAEQARIVAVLDGLLGRVRTAQEQTVPKLLKRFRQGVLSAAVSGKLTEVDEESWEATNLMSVIKEKPRNGFSPQPVNHPTATKSLTLSATTSGKFNPKYFKYIENEISLDSHLWLRKGDILIQRANSLDFVGTAAIYDQKDLEFIYPDLMMKVTANEKILPEYLLYCLSEPSTRIYFKDNATGSTGNMPKINQGTVMNTPILLPQLPEQQEIVRWVSGLLVWADKLEEGYEAAKRQLDAMPAAILAKAFAGELTEQNLDDEPASVMLERIRAERLAEQQRPKEKKKPTIDKTPKRRKTMAEQLRSIKEILTATPAPVSAHTVWQQSVYYNEAKSGSCCWSFPRKMNASRTCPEKWCYPN